MVGITVNNMKIRNGFVSNSSSSSFCILGVEVSKAQYKKLINSDTKLNYCRGVESTDLFWAGLDIKEIDGNETLNDFKETVVTFLKRDVDNKISVNRVDWIFGECDQDSNYVGEDDEDETEDK